VGYFYIKYTKDKKTLFLALIRMVTQLLLIGYLLVFIFKSNSVTFILVILSIMLFFASLISLRPIKVKSLKLYLISFISILIGGGVILAIVLFGVLQVKVWYEPKVIIPLAGMIFANSMNAISLFAKSYEQSTNLSESFKTALIPTLNTFFAVGLVSLPGMMTGQILSGVDPLIAVRYQIMVMLMVLGASGVSIIIFYKLISNNSTF
jgi:putative ABC transport system permease protein